MSRSTVKRTIVGVIVGVVLCGVTGDHQANGGQETPKKTKQKYDGWMAVKLASSQQIVAHLTDAEFKNQSGDNGQLHAFEFAAKELVRNAEDEDMNGALKSFQLMTESCVRCHQLVRDPKEPS